MEARDSILKGIIKKSLVAFPEDAHQRVLQFLLDGGLEESHSLKFRQAWSKVVLGTQAFGRASKNKIDPDLFSDELIRELSFADEAVVKLMDAADACLKLDHHRDTLNTASKTGNTQDTRNPRDGAAALEAMGLMGQSLVKALAGIYQETKTAEEGPTVDLFESVGLFRKSLRGTRIAWSGPLESAYVPLDLRAHGQPDLIRGHLDMQLRTERHDLNVYMSTDQLLGVVVSREQSVHQERAWNAYLCLTELLSSRGDNLFPLPIGVNRNPATLSTTFAFESAAGSRALLGLVGPALGTYLRRNPSVVHQWTAQLSAAAAALQLCSGCLSKPIRLADVYVRENGLLLVGGVAFNAVPPGSDPGCEVRFLRVCCDLLARALCLSRREAASLQFEDSAREEEDEEEEDYAQRAEERRRAEAAGETVLSVTVGSSLVIDLGGHRCSRVMIEEAVAQGRTRGVGAGVGAAGRTGGRGGQEATASALATLTVNVAATGGSYKQLAGVEAEVVPGKGAQPAQCSLLLRTLHPGILSLYVSAMVQEDEGVGTKHLDRPLARYRRKTLRIRVVVVPAYAVETVALQDLIGHLEEVHAWGDASILKHAQLFQHPHLHNAQKRDTNPSSTERGAERDEQALRVQHSRDVQRHWQDILRILANYGNMHLPPA